MVYTLATDGCILGWSAMLPFQQAAPVPCVEPVARDAWTRAEAEWRARMHECIEYHHLRVRVCSWNVNEQKPDIDSIRKLVCPDCKDGCASPTLPIYILVVLGGFRG